MKPITETLLNDDSARAAEWRPGVVLCLALIRGYQLIFSQFFRGECRFLPSCSEYAVEAVERHGALQGSWLAVTRLIRCHPLCAAGHDPVPAPRGSVRL